MHGRPRVKASDQDPAIKVQAAKEKAVLLSKLLGVVLTRRHEQRYDQESLGFAAKLLELNPEVYTVWNYRREAIEQVLKDGGDAAIEAVNCELELTQRALMRNPKSYSTWHHRKWVVAAGFSSLEKEMQLVGKLLDADERNFHGWGYRRFIAERMGLPVQVELDYTRLKIEQNFSNYSAWHYRTTLLPLLHTSPTMATSSTLSSPPSLDNVVAKGTSHTVRASGTAVIPLAVLQQEYELVKNALYTEPEDQSGWFYHRWLLGCSLARWRHAQAQIQSITSLTVDTEKKEEEEERQGLLETLQRELATCQELLEVEPDSKWPLLTKTRLQELLKQVLVQPQVPAVTLTAEENLKNEVFELEIEIQGAYKQLSGVDSMRSGYYVDAAEGRALVVAVPSRTN